MNSGGHDDGGDAHAESGDVPDISSELIAFATLLSLHRIAVDPGQLRYDLGHFSIVSAADLLRLAKGEPVRTRRVIAGFDGLKAMPLPILANGPLGWFLIGKVSDDHALISVARPCARTVGARGVGAMLVGQTRACHHPRPVRYTAW